MARLSLRSRHRTRKYSLAPQFPMDIDVEVVEVLDEVESRLDVGRSDLSALSTAPNSAPTPSPLIENPSAHIVQDASTNVAEDAMTNIAENTATYITEDATTIFTEAVVANIAEVATTIITEAIVANIAENVAADITEDASADIAENATYITQDATTFITDAIVADIAEHVATYIMKDEDATSAVAEKAVVYITEDAITNFTDTAANIADAEPSMCTGSETSGYIMEGSVHKQFEIALTSEPEEHTLTATHESTHESDVISSPAHLQDAPSLVAPALEEEIAENKEPVQKVDMAFRDNPPLLASTSSLVDAEDTIEVDQDYSEPLEDDFLAEMEELSKLILTLSIADSSVQLSVLPQSVQETSCIGDHDTFLEQTYASSFTLHATTSLITPPESPERWLQALNHSSEVQDAITSDSNEDSSQLIAVDTDVGDNIPLPSPVTLSDDCPQALSFAPLPTPDQSPTPSHTDAHPEPSSISIDLDSGTLSSPVIPSDSSIPCSVEPSSPRLRTSPPSTPSVPLNVTPPDLEIVDPTSPPQPQPLQTFTDPILPTQEADTIAALDSQPATFTKTTIPLACSPQATKPSTSASFTFYAPLTTSQTAAVPCQVPDIAPVFSLEPVSHISAEVGTTQESMIEHDSDSDSGPRRIKPLPNRRCAAVSSHPSRTIKPLPSKRRGLHSLDSSPDNFADLMANTEVLSQMLSTLDQDKYREIMSMWEDVSSEISSSFASTSSDSQSIASISAPPSSEMPTDSFSETSAYSYRSVVERDRQEDEPGNGYNLTLDFGLASTTTMENSRLPSFAASSSSLAGALIPPEFDATIASLAPSSALPQSDTGEWSQTGTESSLDPSITYEGGVWYTTSPQPSSSSLSGALGSDELQHYYDVLASQVVNARESTDPPMATAATVSRDGLGSGSFTQIDEEDEDEDDMEEQYIPPYTGTD